MRLAWLVPLLLSCVGHHEARAHAFSPGLLEVQQQTADSFLVHWTPPRGSAESESGNLKVEPIFPADCTSQPLAGDDSGAATLLLRCGDQGLDGATLTIRNLAVSRSDALVRLRWLDGSDLSGVVHAGAPELRVPAGSRHGSGWQVGAHYAQLGVRHIAAGWDHLMFLYLLVLLARARHPTGTGLAKSVLWTATAFTLAHSITLSMAALGVLRLAPQPVEATIALSICFLAAALVPKGVTTLRHQDAAFAFGLLHGLGFAGALREAGLPPTHLPLALLSFNVGVEIGQILFVSAVIVAVAGVERIGLTPRRLQLASAYAMGVVAAAATIERVVLFWR